MTTVVSNKFSIKETQTLIRLAFPLIVTGLVEASIGFFSTLFLARLGPKELAAGALVSWLFVTLMVILWGTLNSVSILVAQKHGKKDELAISFILRDGLILAALLTLPTFILLWYMAPILLLAGQNPDVVALANTYLHGLAWGLLPDFVMLVLLQFVIGLGHTRTSLFFTIIWVPISVSLIYILMFGKLGLPALGIEGIGWGMTISYWIIAIALIVYGGFSKRYTYYIKKMMNFVRPYYLTEILMVGMPMGVMYCLEVAFFLIITLIMGTLSNQILAANQIAFQFLGQIMAIIFALAQAITVRMGHKLGAKEVSIAQQTAYSGIVISFAILIPAALCYWFLPNYLLMIDINIYAPENADIVKYAKGFLFVSAIFQLFEGLRITLFGALRSLKDTRHTLVISIISFWGIALPLGCLFSYAFDWKAYGIWWGMVIGVIYSCIILYRRFQYKMNKAFHSSKPIVL